MSFWTGFLVGVGVTYGVSAGVVVGIALLASRRREPKPWGEVEGFVLFDGVGEDFGEEPADDSPTNSTPIPIAFTHTSTLGNVVKGDG